MQAAVDPLPGELFLHGLLLQALHQQGQSIDDYRLTSR